MRPVRRVTAGYAIAYLWWERTGLGSAELRDLVGNIGFMPLNLACLVLNGLASQNPTLDPAVRRALRFMALGCLCVLLGNMVSVYYTTALGANPPVSWADPFYLVDSLLILAALLSFPLTRRTRLERWKFALDAAMVLLGGGVAIWYYSVRPTWAAEGGSIIVTVLAFAYPLVSLLLLLGVTTVLLRGPLDGNRRAFALLLAGVVVSIVADLTFDLVLLETGQRTAAWTDAVYLLTYLLLIGSAEYYYRHPVPGSTAAAEQRPRTQPLSPLPYLALMTAYGLLFAAALQPWTDPVSGLAVGAVLITALVVARQVLAVRENVRLLAETAARQNEVRFRSLVQHSSDVIIVIRPDGAIRFVSPSVSRVMGHEPDALADRSLFDLLHPDDRDRARTFCREAGQLAGVTAPVEWRFRLPDGSLLHAEMIATNLLDEPAVRGIVLNTRDVSERKRLEKELLHQAFHDPLTGLANRALFRDRVSHALTLARRHGHAITVLFLDLDDFKKVNDSLGHAEGDRLLVAAAERFRSCARATDTIARLGGDEFAILVEDSPGPEGHATMVERLATAMAQPFILGGTEVQVNASVGVAVTSGGESADDLLRNADVAMYTAKRRGKGRSEIYQAHMYVDIRERLELESALRTAIETERLVLHYQPIVSLRTGAVRGLEALLRWDPPLGPPPPGPAVAGAFHRPGGGNRAHREPGQLGAAGGLPSGPGLADDPPGPGSFDRGQHLGPSAAGARHRRRGSPGAGGIGCGPASGRARDHRERPDAADRSGAGAAARAQGAGYPARDRRLRHRLLVAGLSAPFPDRHPQDRKAVRGRCRRGPRALGHCSRHRRPERHAPAPHHRRRCRIGRAASRAAGSGLRARPGPLLRRCHARQGVRGMARPVGTGRRLAHPLL